ncbi:MAG: hypothetical protein HYZ37_13935 [Candidatus Solibacter usitatus]|nr:hypothetical protein [Candidatus Solibacter usitatus]
MADRQMVALITMMGRQRTPLCPHPSRSCWLATESEWMQVAGRTAARRLKEYWAQRA